MFNISRMNYPLLRYWVSAMVCAFVEVAENLVVLVSLGALRPFWVIPCIAYFCKRDLQQRIKEQEIQQRIKERE